MESTEMISPPILSASTSAISDFPTAVGPPMKIKSAGIIRQHRPELLRRQLLSRNVSGKFHEQDHSRSKNRHAHQLRRSKESAVNMCLRIIAPEQFDDGPSHRIANQV